MIGRSRSRIPPPVYHQLVAKRGCRSGVWQFFGLPADESGRAIDGNISICKVCKSTVSSKSGTTTNLKSHLKVHHPVQYMIVMNSNGNTTEDTMLYESEEEDDQSSLILPIELKPNIAEMPVIACYDPVMEDEPQDAKSAKKCADSIAKFLVTTMQPLGIVEDSSFKEMVQTLNPKYFLPASKYFSQISIPKMYNAGVKQLKEILEKEGYNVSDFSITCDCSTSIAGHPYLTLTLYFINADWNLFSFCLSCVAFEENLSPENLKEIIRTKLEEWDLNMNSVISCTTDRGANMVNGMKLLEINHVPCFVDSINVGVNTAVELPKIKKALKQLKLLQNSISHNWKVRKGLKEAHELLLCQGKSFCNAYPTAWWPTLKLCKRFLDNQSSLQEMFQNVASLQDMLQSFPTTASLVPDKSEVACIKQFVEVASVLEDVLNNLMTENYVSSSAILPLIRRIKRKLKVEESDESLVKNLKECILSVFSRYENNKQLKTLLQYSTFVDPRFRLKFFDDADQEEVKLEIIDELHAIQSTFKTQECNPPPKKKRGLSLLLEDEVGSISDPKAKSMNEVNNYLSMPKIEIDDDPLEWWQQYAQSFPLLSILAKRYLSIQGCRVPADRVIYTGDRDVSKSRSLETVEMQLFLSHNKKILDF